MCGCLIYPYMPNKLVATDDIYDSGPKQLTDDGRVSLKSLVCLQRHNRSPWIHSFRLKTCGCKFLYRNCCEGLREDELDQTLNNFF